MATYEDASRTKDHFQAVLLRDHPEIVSLAPRLVLNDAGGLTTEAVIVVGISRAQRPLSSVGGSDTPSIPAELPIVNENGDPTNTTIPVIIEDEGELVAEVYTAHRRPCPGGYSIGHPHVTAGTLGGVARINHTRGYILSNNHVLAAANSGAVNDPIYQPGVYDGGTSGHTIGTLLRWVPIDFSGGNNEVDAALATAHEPPSHFVHSRVEGIGVPAREVHASVGQHIRKSGRTTQLTYGRILSDNATARVRYGVGHVAIFVNQLQYTRMTQGGDSGSLVWDRDNLCVLGLHFAGSGAASYGNKIRRVLDLLSSARIFYNDKGERMTFDPIELRLS